VSYVNRQELEKRISDLEENSRKWEAAYNTLRGDFKDRRRKLRDERDGLLADLDRLSAALAAKQTEAKPEPTPARATTPPPRPAPRPEPAPEQPAAFAVMVVSRSAMNSRDQNVWNADRQAALAAAIARGEHVAYIP
jgi:hypothetical protein